MERQGKKFDIYEAVTRQILSNMAKGVIPWRQIWTARKGQKHPFTNRFTGKPYSFLNTLLLGEPGEYATFKQIKDAGGHILKGAKARMVIYWGEFTPKENREEEKRLLEEGKDTSHLKVKFPKYYHVFNIKDTEGVKAEAEPAPMVEAEDPTDIAELIIGEYRTSEDILVESREGLVPAYVPATDSVTLPPKEDFAFEEDFYRSLFEQLVHSTAADGRCSRSAEFKVMSEGGVSEKEELIAEIGSSMCLSVAGMKRRETHEQVSAECQKWIKVLGGNNRLLIQASYSAEKAARLVLGNYAA